MLKFHDGKTKCVCYLLDCSNHKPLSLVKMMNRLEKILPETFGPFWIYKTLTKKI